MATGTSSGDAVARAVQLAAVARGERQADLAVVNGRVFCAFTREWLDVDVLVAGGSVASLRERDGTEVEAGTVLDARGAHVVPGFIDAHVHIESSKLTPRGFADVVLRHGTTTVVAEPHEIGNVLGVPGVEWIMEACEGLPLDVHFMVPSCVPASPFESAGAELGVAEMEHLLEHPRMLGVGELMNFPGVVNGDEQTLARAHVRGSSHVDGHAPGLRGSDLDAYVAAGIHSDHESTTPAEARDKLRRGMWVLLREASNARNLVDLLPVVQEFGPGWCAFCTDDREPDDLLRQGHIDHMCRLAVQHGVTVEDALVLATLHPAAAHGLHEYGAIAPGRMANMLVLEDLQSFTPRTVIARGAVVVDQGRRLWTSSDQRPGAKVCGTVHVAPVTASDLLPPPVTAPGETVAARVIGVQDGQLLTEARTEQVRVVDGQLQPDPHEGLSYLAVVERHRATGRIGHALVHGFGLRRGAIASSVAHDAHNLVIAGADAESMAACVARLAELGGGICVADGGTVVAELALPVAGLMSDEPVEDVVATLDLVHAAARALGSGLEAPFMALSFVALSVIPSLKLTDRGLVDVDAFELVSLLAENPAHADHSGR